ncbi:MAG: hypothetical protein K2G97_01685, partial [Oscillospiraceae bacterium]|nr:hypothetical protein [Oscillospiraceae bacterium]
KINTQKKTIKKLLSVALTASIITTSFASVGQASAKTIGEDLNQTTQVVAKTQTVESQAEPVNEIVINDKEGFSLFMRNYSFWRSDTRVILNNDIDMEGEKFEPIEEFSGEFDGCGHVVNNLVIEDRPDELAFIKKMNSGSKFQNVTFEKYIIKMNLNVVFGRVKKLNYRLAGFVNINEGTISNVKFSNSDIGRGDVFIECYGLYTVLSGFVNENYGTIENCNSRVDINNLSLYSGGFCYKNLGNIVSCESEGILNSFFAKDIDATSAGGFVYENKGIIKDSKSNVRVSCEECVAGFCCKNKGKILTSKSEGNVSALAISTNNVCGGFVGENSGMIKECSATGIAVGEECVGGFAGVNKSYIIDCNALGKTTAKTKTHTAVAGGFVGKNEGGAITNSTAKGGAEASSNSGQAKAGGFVGVNKSIITNSKSSGYVYLSAGTCYKDNGCGGFVGQNSKNGNIDGCYAECKLETTNKKKGGGFVGEAKKKSMIKNSKCKSVVVAKKSKTKKAEFCYDKSKKAVIENCKAE